MKKSFSDVKWWQAVAIGTVIGIAQILGHEIARAFLPRYFSPAAMDWLDPMSRGLITGLVVLLIIKSSKLKKPQTRHEN